MVKNYVESLVDDALERELEENGHRYTNFCRCPSCLAAVKAVALNRIQPFYITCIAGEVFGEYRSKDLQNLSDILVAIIIGINEVVATCPHNGQILLPA